MVKEKDMSQFPSMKKAQYKPVAKDPAKPMLSFPSMQQKKVPGLTFPSMASVLSERQKAEAGRIADILHPDTSKRLRFPSLGDAPRARPVRTEFKSDAHFKAALAHWNQEQKFEAEVYERSLR